MVNRVGLLAPLGHVGSATLKYMLPLHKAGKIDLALLIRPGSKSRLGDVGDVKVIELDLDGELDNIAKSIEGIQVIVSCINMPGFASQSRLLEAVGKLSHFGVFIPASYSTKFHPEDLTDPGLKAMIEGIVNGVFARAEALGVGMFHLYTGLFDEYFFSNGMVNCSVRDNVLQINDKMLDHELALTTMEHLGASLAYLSALPPSEIAGKELSAVTIMPTGRQIVQAFTKLHNGTPPTINEYDEAARKADYANVPIGPVSATYKRHWETGFWGYPPEVPVETYEGKGETVEQIAKKWL